MYPTVVGFNVKSRKVNLPKIRPTHASALTKKLTQLKKKLNQGNNPNNRLTENLAQGGNVGRIAAHRVVQLYSVNNLRKIINNSILNQNIANILVDGWVRKVINSGNVHEMSKILKLNLNLNYSTKVKLMSAMRTHRNSIISNLIKSGTANEIQKFMNKVNFKTNIATRNKLLTVWSLRRQNTPTLRQMIEHLSSAPYQTKMSKATIAEIRAELNRR
jgi:hypothetical protein